MRIVQIGNTSYTEDEEEKVWMHLVIINHKPIMYATMAPDLMTAHALASLVGEVWDTFPVYDTLEALQKEQATGSLDIGIDTSGVRM